MHLDLAKAWGVCYFNSLFLNKDSPTIGSVYLGDFQFKDYQAKHRSAYAVPLVGCSMDLAATRGDGPLALGGCRHRRGRNACVAAVSGGRCRRRWRIPSLQGNIARNVVALVPPRFLGMPF